MPDLVALTLAEGHIANKTKNELASFSHAFHI